MTDRQCRLDPSIGAATVVRSFRALATFHWTPLGEPSASLYCSTYCLGGRMPFFLPLEAPCGESIGT